MISFRIYWTTLIHSINLPEVALICTHIQHVSKLPFSKNKSLTVSFLLKLILKQSLHQFDKVHGQFRNALSRNGRISLSGLLKRVPQFLIIRFWAIAVSSCKLRSQNIFVYTSYVCENRCDVKVCSMLKWQKTQRNFFIALELSFAINKSPGMYYIFKQIHEVSVLFSHSFTVNASDFIHFTRWLYWPCRSNPDCFLANLKPVWSCFQNLKWSKYCL